MINIDTLSLGCEFKDDNGNAFKVISNFSEGKKIFCELELVEPVDDELMPD